MTDGPQAGWYPDPEDATQQRYWDGEQWTEHRAPLAGATPPPSTPQWPTTGQPQTPTYGGAVAAQQQNQKAMWSMILGILGLVCCGLFAGIPAWILGNQAKQEIAASGGTQSGAGMAQAGFIMGIISVVLSVVGIVIYGLVFAVGMSSGF